MKNEVKVFKMNDYEWWATKGSAEDLNDYYNKDTGNDNDIENLELCDLDKDGMWYQTNDKKDIKKLGDADELSSNRNEFQFGDLQRHCGDVYKYISFREALELGGDFTKPYCIACTEY